MRSLRVDSRLSGHRLHPVGIYKNTVYLRSAREDSVQIWSLNTLFPNSWKCIFNLPVEELIYVFPAFSYRCNRIFILVIAVFKGEHDGRAALFELDRQTLEYKEYRLEVTEKTDFPSIPFETSALAYGSNGLHMFDRAIVMGPIPYWTLELAEDTFSVRRNDVLDTLSVKCNRFTIAVDSGSRVFARLLDDSRLLVSSEDDESWVEYLPSVDTRVNLSELSSRSIRETFGRSGHRAGAVQSPLTIYSDNGVIVAKVTQSHRHFFYRILLNHEKREFCCISAGSACFRGNVDLMFYGMVAERVFVMVGVGSIAVAQLQPPTLSESALWCFQKHNSKTDLVGTSTGGFDFSYLEKMCGFGVAQSFSV